MPEALTRTEVYTAETFPNRKRWTRADCDFLERAGTLTERYELIDGEIIIKVGQNRPHAIAITLLVKWLIGVFGGDFVQCQLPIEIAEADRPGNRPEPDASVLAQPATAYTDSAPGPGDVILAVEVSDTTLRDDLRTKAGLYARAGIPEYWVLDVPSRRLIVHRQPTPNGYAAAAAYREDESIATETAPGSAVRVADLLPPAQA